MNPSCNLREWSSDEARQLLKLKGTIQDVDGECTLRLTGQSRTGCPVAPHYRLPLYALNKKFGIYRQIVGHLQNSSSPNAAGLKNTYLSIMRYLHDVRISFLHDSVNSADPRHGAFRSAVFDYYLWLDHTVTGFHEQARSELKDRHEITFEILMNNEGKSEPRLDALLFRTWPTVAYGCEVLNVRDSRLAGLSS
jgi:hypothetical protein